MSFCLFVFMICKHFLLEFEGATRVTGVQGAWPPARRRRARVG